MAKQKGVLELEVAEGRALDVCRQVFEELAWELLVDEDGRIVAHEDATVLPCHCQPATVDLRVDRGDDAPTSITIETKVPGFGPIASTQARGRQNAVVRRIHARATGDRASSTD